MLTALAVSHHVNLLVGGWMGRGQGWSDLNVDKGFSNTAGADQRGKTVAGRLELQQQSPPCLPS